MRWASVVGQDAGVRFMRRALALAIKVTESVTHAPIEHLTNP